MIKRVPEKLDKNSILNLIAQSPVPLTKRDIVDAFGIRGDDRREIKDILRELKKTVPWSKRAGLNTAIVLFTLLVIIFVYIIARRKKLF